MKMNHPQMMTGRIISTIMMTVFPVTTRCEDTLVKTCQNVRIGFENCNDEVLIQ